MEKTRTDQIHLRVSPEERDMFEAVAAERRQTIAVVIRDLVLREHRRLTTAKSAKR
jgi:hypothetical protein